MKNDLTLRLLFPEWQGGINKNYHFGASILSIIAPEGENHETAEVPVDTDFSAPQKTEDGVFAQAAIIRQQLAARKILMEKQPARVITFGGDCSVSQAPFDYLHHRYPGLGILWIDAHPDISTPEIFSNEHAMVLGNLLGDGAPRLSEIVEHPFSPEKIFYVGIIADKMLPHEKEYVAKRALAYMTPEEANGNREKLHLWLKKNQIQKLAVHFDVDVLTATDFRSVLYNEPGLGPVDYATGTMTLARVTEILVELQKISEIVGFTFAEYMPWDLIRLRAAMEKISIFK
ncbi:MAG: arginase family protein [Planctomycetia bacterium]|nr:arginase family protein [Planctomycetia bacterium]